LQSSLQFSHQLRIAALATAIAFTSGAALAQKTYDTGAYTSFRQTTFVVINLCVRRDDSGIPGSDRANIQP
jgi:hypothetical protein